MGNGPTPRHLERLLAAFTPSPAVRHASVAGLL